jgi:hypothetical protein
MPGPVTASSWWLARECVYPWTSGIPWPVRRPSWAATLGTISHALIEQAIDQLNGHPGVPKGAVVGTARQNQLAAQNKVLAISWLGGATHAGATLQPELALSYKGGQPGTPTRLHVHRDYKVLGEVTIAGTADLVVSSPLTGGGTSVRVFDWKTGLYAEPYTSRARQQILCLSAMHPGPDVAAGAAVYLDARGTSVREVVVHVDPLEIQLTRAKFAQVEAALLSKQGPRPGLHCSGCPIRTRCPEYGGQ